MPEATFWFSSPFREWIGQRTVTVHWEGRMTLREVLERLAAEHPKFQVNAVGAGLRQESFSNLAAVLLEGDFLALDSAIPDGAKVDVFTPLAGGGCAGLSLPADDLRFPDPRRLRYSCPVGERAFLADAVLVAQQRVGRWNGILADGRGKRPRV